MRKLKFFIICLILTSCQKFTSPATYTENSKIPEDLVIGLERTGCFAGANACPTYKLTITADGSVVFEGIDVTKTRGRVEDKISPEKIRLLLKEFNKADFFDLENSYDHENCPSVATDSPDANTSIQINGKKKTIHHYSGCRGKDTATFPAQLTELENKIDEIVETKRWIGERE